VDDRSFDLLVKRLGEQRTRRASVRALAGGALSAVVVADASTDAKKKKKKCKAPKVTCGRKLCCAAGQACVNGACVTATTTTTTSRATTTSTTSTTPNPGVCTPSCRPGQRCVDAKCSCDVDLCNALFNPNPRESDCFCDQTADGQTQCLATQDCLGGMACGPGNSCPSDSACLLSACNNQPTCFKTCVVDLPTP
jgi:hypothetical protein